MKESGRNQSWIRSIVFQSFLGIGVWMSFGLLLEGLLGFKTPTYLQDDVRRELFRLAHAHGTLVNLLLLGAALACDRLEIAVSKTVRVSLRTGVVLLPLGFFMAGVWHYESDPGVAIWLVPPSALLLIFALVALALSVRRSRN
jgi:hypothetical protein